MLSYNGHRLEVREIVLADLPLIDAYWERQSACDLARMKVDPSKLTVGAEERHRRVAEMLQLPLAQRKAQSLMWMVDSQTIGMSVLREIIFGEYGEIHLHNFYPEQRRKGYGSRLFLLSLQRFTEMFQLKKIACEPAAENPHPNGTLHKLGFKPARTYQALPSSICEPCTVNRYEINTSDLSRVTLSGC